jgi:hypothetical protein
MAAMISEGQLARLHHQDQDCPGPWRVVTKLPRLDTPPIAAEAVDAAVVRALLNQTDLIQDIASLTGEALRRLSPPSGDGPSAAVIKGVAARVAAGLAVGLMESDLALRIERCLEAGEPFADSWRSCPE